MDSEADLDPETYFSKHTNFGNATADYNDKNIAQLIERAYGEDLAKIDAPPEQVLAAGVLAWKMRRHAKECDGC